MLDWTKQRYTIPKNKTFPKDVRISRLPGVYLFLGTDDTVLYVGKALSLIKRLQSYFRSDADTKQKAIVQMSTHIAYVETDSEFNALILETVLIKKHKPRYNILHKDDKQHVYIRITIGEQFPRVTTARREDDADSLYFGPFPKSRTVKEVIRMLRRIFPFCQRTYVGKRACFYHHLGLCDPCPSEIMRQSPEHIKKETRRYRKNIHRLVHVLSAKYPSVLADMTRDMQEASEKEKFEDAAVLRDQIRKLEYITTQRYRIASFLEDPSFLSKERDAETTALATVLSPHIPHSTPLQRIECFDISNLFGEYAVGSMVVFIHGVQQQAAYRRFRIRTIHGINDVAMMYEVISRRIRHLHSWGTPDLIVVDGGKGQIRAAQGALASHNLAIPIIGLAKRFEQIIVPDGGKKRGFTTLQLPLSHPAINILRSIRDEAHRFAITYHKKLRRTRLPN